MQAPQSWREPIVHEPHKPMWAGAGRALALEKDHHAVLHRGGIETKDWVVLKTQLRPSAPPWTANEGVCRFGHGTLRACS